MNFKKILDSFLSIFKSEPTIIKIPKNIPYTILVKHTFNDKLNWCAFNCIIATPQSELPGALKNWYYPMGKAKDIMDTHTHHTGISNDVSSENSYEDWYLFCEIFGHEGYFFNKTNIKWIKL